MAIELLKITAPPDAGLKGVVFKNCFHHQA
ncbi:hypothetical protein DET64_105348 [Marinobacter nauticus]|jgi:hypothetical protein|uniref:Uncharacterized protein n=1 Tax=Marinobacter nauticus TaxID=2743 RepID=A0A368V196_MARNT|nr:hypothetical protein DET64_105348 [Marinobacter nauticus]RCW34967.1 hypothetical protein DET51_105347 [Marinobacter nauticus]